MKILVTGSIAYDLLLSYDGSFADAIQASDLKNLSVSFFSPRFAKHHGGTGANIAWNLMLLRQEPLLVGTVGNDGAMYTALLEERGISTQYVEVVREHVTATAIIGTDSHERQIAFFHPGADSHGTWPSEALADEREDIAYGLVGARDAGAMMQGVRFLRQWKIPYLFDPGQLVIGLSPDELKSAIRGSAGVIANAYEWSLLSEKIQWSTDDVLKETAFLVVTHGEEGLTIYNRGLAGGLNRRNKTQTEKIHVIPACKPDCLINPTGAGDGLRAGLLTGLSRGWSLFDAGRLGASLASFVVEQEGTLIDHLDVNDVMSRAEMTYGERLPDLS